MDLLLSQGNRTAVKVRAGIKVLATVDLVNLRALAVEGSTDAIGNGLRVNELDVAIGGWGNVRQSDLQASAVERRLAGGGATAPFGRAAGMSARIAGSGDVRHLDNPRITQRIAGNGKVAQG